MLAETVTDQIALGNGSLQTCIVRFIAAAPLSSRLLRDFRESPHTHTYERNPACWLRAKTLHVGYLRRALRSDHDDFEIL